MSKKLRGAITAAACLTAAAAVTATALARPSADHHRPPPHAHSRHVLLMSVDGMHASDLARFAADNPGSELAALSRRGTSYSQASTTTPSDSFPGVLALATGGTPRSTGVYYDDSYDRTLFAPGSTCTGAPGTEIDYSENVDRDKTRLDGGGNSTPASIDPAKLPRSAQTGCQPVYPHSFLRVNTVFEVAKAAGLRTAWSDKHPSYDLLNGPSGHGVDDLYTPEIASTAPGTSGDFTKSEALAAQYDQLKVQAVLNEINGHTSTGAPVPGSVTPAILGMNFQSLSVAQKTTGYLDHGTRLGPDVDAALRFVDRSLAAMDRGLRSRGLLDSTEIIVTAKHGQSPINRDALNRVPHDPVSKTVTDAGCPPAQATTDDIELLWLSNQGCTDVAAQALRANAGPDFIDHVLAGDPLTERYGNPLSDPRTPDIIVQPQHGVIYTGNTVKIAEHGGGTPDDTNVALLVVPGGRSFGPRTVPAAVSTTQVAPTILRYLRLDPESLQAVQQEDKRALPVGFGD